MLERFEKSDGLGAIYPAMLNSIVAMRVLGYSLDDPQMIRAMDEFEKLGIDCPDGEPDYPTPTFRMQPCYSPVWDTAQVVSALGEAGLSKTDPRLLKAADWLLSKEVRHKGDWAEKVEERRASAAGTSSSTMSSTRMSMILERFCWRSTTWTIRGSGTQHEVCQRALNWIWAMQCKNGGWAAFDKDNTKTILSVHSVRRS